MIDSHDEENYRILHEEPRPPCFARNTILVISLPNLTKFALLGLPIATKFGATVRIQKLSAFDYLWHFKTGVMSLQSVIKF